jgi:hypothetical protein
MFGDFPHAKESGAVRPCKGGKSSEGGPDADIGHDPTHDRQVAFLAGAGVRGTMGPAEALLLLQPLLLAFYFHHYYLRYPGSSVERR